MITMQFVEERIGQILGELGKLKNPLCSPLTEWEMAHACKEELRVSGEPELSDLENQLRWHSFVEHEKWGGHEVYLCFKTEAVIPASMKGKCVEFCLETGKEGEWDAINPQFTVYINGVLRQGFDVNHRSIRLCEKAVAGDRYQILLRAYSGTRNDSLCLNSWIQTVDLDIERYYYDLCVPHQIAGLLEQTEKTYLRIIEALNHSINLLDMRKPHSKEFYDSLIAAQEDLQTGFYDRYSGNAEACVYCVGHTHIDIAWLWTLDVTRDKAVRSFSTALELMRRYPDYIFMSSQPQLYQYVKEDAPQIYEEIKKRVEEGRWEVEGSMYVEPDCNIPSGESLVRQCLYGKRFFKQEFGKENRILWLPDVFGYSAALPQIMKKSGIDYFMTTKISWNETNKMPYDTFYWEGIDGTKVLTHFIPSRDYVSATRDTKTNNEHCSTITTNYNGYIHPSQIKGSWQRYQQKELNDEVLMSYGYGDGGGGPTANMLETGMRLKKALPGCPAVKMTTAGEFFEKLKEQTEGNIRTPIWSGELYLEYHRGTYTSMARNKKSNRRGEFELLNVELWSVMASELLGVPYQREVLKECWEILMRNQFHDILPGSSIKEVYEDSKQEYLIMEDKITRLRGEVLGKLAERVDAPEGAMVVFNPNSFENSDFVDLSEQIGLLRAGDYLTDGENQSVIQQRNDGQLYFRAQRIPAKGYKAYWKAESNAESNTESNAEVSLNSEDLNWNFDGNTLDTKYYRICINEKGQFTSMFDKEEQREILKEGQYANVLMTYEDKPHDFDSWNIYQYYQEKSWEICDLVQMEVLKEGALKSGIYLKWRYLDSKIEQRIYFYSDTKRIDFCTKVDWKEQQLLLKALFPVELNSREGTFEIQYGNVKRNMIRNTSWDQARFEVCYQKWMDISEDNYGVSFLNDCKYGVSVDENLVGLSLLKSGIYPNPTADQEEHEFTYSIYPHQGDWKDAKTVGESYKLNNPMTAVRKNSDHGFLPANYSYVTVSEDNIIVEAVKMSEDSSFAVIRLYECFNRKTRAALHFHKPILSIGVCNMMEQPDQSDKELEVSGCECKIEVKPYEIMTFLVQFEEHS